MQYFSEFYDVSKKNTILTDRWRRSIPTLLSLQKETTDSQIYHHDSCIIITYHRIRILACISHKKSESQENSKHDLTLSLGHRTPHMQA